MTTHPPLKVVCAVSHSYDLDPAQRYRWEQWQPHLLDHGIRLELLPFCTPAIDDRLRRGQFGRASMAALLRYPTWLSELASATRADALVIARKAIPVGQPFAELAVAMSPVPLVYDFDDAIFLRPPGRASVTRSLARARWRCPALCALATHVLVGNEYLAAYARRHARAVTVIPTTVDTDKHVPRPEPKSAGGHPVFGWSGSASTVRYLQTLLPMIAIAQQQVPFELLVVGAEVDLGGVAGRCVPWTSAREVALLQEMDLGLMPLDDGPWERGKCALKALLYQSVGIPAIVSDVGMNPQAVLHERTGFVVSRRDEWIARMVQMAREPELRRRLGQHARQHVANEYSPRRWVPSVASALRQAAGRQSG